MRAAVFLDRDDTLMRDVPYCRRPEDVHLLDGAGLAVRRINELGLLAVVVTNQSGIRRGLLTEADLGAVNEELRRQIALDGGRIDAIYACPHQPEDACACRKPGTLLFEKACRDHRIDPTRSFVVGDRGYDIEAARRIGARGVLLRNDVGLADVKGSGADPDLLCKDLLEFVSWLAAQTRAETLAGPKD
jgi:histidinol-phosphate phosphatase family protein